MHVSPPSKKHERFDLIAAVGGAFMILGFGLVGALGPWLPQKLSFLGLMGPYMGLPGFFFIVGGVISAVRHHLHLKGTLVWSILSLIVVYFATFSPSVQTASWKAHAGHTLAQREEALRWVRAAKRPTRVRDLYSYYKLPPSMESAAERGEVVSYRDSDGHRWLTFSVFTNGIDNSQGYVWSETGAPPPRLAYPEVTYRESLGGGWFWFRST